MRLRIIAGKYKSRKIEAPEGIRPTRDKIRESIFNILAADMEGACVLDLFAGSGALGLEALSRGAKRAVFVDNSRECADAINDNIDGLKIEENVKVIRRPLLDAVKEMAKDGEKFDIVFLDPPYHRNWVKKSLQYMSLYDILSPQSLIIAEHFKRDEVPAETDSFALTRRLSYGDTIISIYSRTAK